MRTRDEYHGTRHQRRRAPEATPGRVRKAMKSAYGRQSPAPDYELTCLAPINVVRDAAANRRIPTGARNTVPSPAEAAALPHGDDL